MSPELCCAPAETGDEVHPVADKITAVVKARRDTALRMAFGSKLLM
jgi:hypothetical protein